MALFDAVILDWAGTTVDYGCFAPVQAFAEAFGEYGIQPTMDEIRGPMGMLKRDHVRTMLEMERISGEWERIHGRAFTQEDVEQVYLLSESKILGLAGGFTKCLPRNPDRPHHRIYGCNDGHRGACRCAEGLQPGLLVQPGFHGTQREAVPIYDFPQHGGPGAIRCQAGHESGGYGF